MPSILYQHHDEMELDEILSFDSGSARSIQNFSFPDVSTPPLALPQSGGDMFAESSLLSQEEAANSEASADTETMGVSDMILQMFPPTIDPSDVRNSSPAESDGLNIDVSTQPVLSLEDAIDPELNRDDICMEDEPPSQIEASTHRWRSIVPERVLQLFSQIRSSLSDWAFVHTISAQLCQDFLPMDCFVSLKQGLLLSLASFQVIVFKIFF